MVLTFVRRRRSFRAFSLLLLLLFAAANLRAGDVTITPESPEGQNITNAAQLLESLGAKTAADQIRQRLKNGGYSYGTVKDGNAETNVGFQSTLIDTGFVHSSQPAVPVYKRFDQILRLACLLFHENFHSGQSTLRVMWSTNWEETPAWSATISMEMGWINLALAGVPTNLWPGNDPTATGRVLSPQETLELVRELNQYLGDLAKNKYFGFSAEVIDEYKNWQLKLGELEKQLSAAIDASKSQSEPSANSLPGAAPTPPVLPAPPAPPPLPPLTPGKPVPIAARLPLPKCWPAGTNVKAACKPWLDIAERNQLAADVAGRALANADSDLAQADRLDALATQWDDHAKSLANASADYEAMSQSDRQKAGSSSSTDSAVLWENLANQAQAQSKTLSDQAAQAQAQTDAIRGEAKALRDNVAAEKADEAAKKAAAAASWQDYNDCLKLPECPQNGQPVTTPPVETGSAPPTPSPAPTTPSSTTSTPSPSIPADTPVTPSAPQGTVTNPGDTGKPTGQQGNTGGAAPGGIAVPGNCATVETPPFDDTAPWLPPLPEVGPPPEVPECGDPGQCAALLQYAQFLEVVAKLASERAANAEGYLKDAASLDAQAQAENDSASKYEAEASNYDALEAQSRSKAGSASTTQSAVAWEAIANDEAAQARCYRAQAQEFRDYAAKLTNKANAIRDAVTKAKADVENAEQAATAAKVAYQQCLKRPPCPQPTETTPAETPPGDETNQPSDMGGGPPPDSGAGGQQPNDGDTDPGADVDPDSYMVDPDTPDAENPDDSAPIVVRIQIVLTANGVQIAVVKNNPVPAHHEAIFSLANDSFGETATEAIDRAKGPYLPAVYHPDKNDQELAPGTIVRVVRSASSSFGPSPTEKNGRKYSLVANGTSSGEGLELQVLDPSGKLKKVAMPEGVALEPLERSSRRPVAENAPKGANVVTKPVTIYCAEFSKAPPEPGMQYRIAPQAIQQTYAPAKPVLRAGRELAAAGKLHPDSDPKAYVDSIRQYALWTRLEGWDQKRFGDMFVERTKKNAEALHVKWTPQMENALRGAVPGRWNDISQVLQRADQISKAKQTKRKAGTH